MARIPQQLGLVSAVPHEGLTAAGLAETSLHIEMTGLASLHVTAGEQSRGEEPNGTRELEQELQEDLRSMEVLL